MSTQVLLRELSSQLRLGGTSETLASRTVNAAADQIDSLEAKVKALEFVHAFATQTLGSDAKAAMDGLEFLSRSLAEACDLLEPMAKSGREVDPNHCDGSNGWAGGVRMPTFGQQRAAGRLLERIELFLKANGKGKEAEPNAQG